MGTCFSKTETNTVEPQTHKISCYQKLCCKIGGFEVRVNSVLEALPLTFEQKRIIRKRLVKQVVNLEDDCKKVSFRYNLCRIIIGIGSMALPSLQGLQGQDNTKDWEVELFWGGIFISLCVMIANSMISMFQLDKNYILYNVTNERLKSTMWKYFEQSGQFAGKSYNDNWVIFWNEIEKIKALQITSEYAESDNNDNSMSNKEVQEVVKKHEDENNKKKIIMDALKQQVLKQKMLLKSKVQEIELPELTQDIVDEIQDVSKVNIIIDEDNEEVLYFDENSEQQKELIQKNKEDKKKIKDNKIISEDKTTI
jgi:hypothetical protein